MKNNKGITLIALIITIIVMLILAAVTINMIIGEDGIIARAKVAIRNHKIAEVKETILTDLNSRYYTTIGRNMEEETLQKMAELSVDYDISPEKFSVHYIKNTIREKKEYILVRIDMLTEEEKKILKENEILEVFGKIKDDESTNNLVKSINRGILPLLGDWNSDGFITDLEHKILESISNNGIYIEGFDKEKLMEKFNINDDIYLNIDDYRIFNAMYGNGTIEEDIS